MRLVAAHYTYSVAHLALRVKHYFALFSCNRIMGDMATQCQRHNITEAGGITLPLSPPAFGAWLGERVVAYGASQVGRLLGVSHSSVLRWLAGTRHPSRTVRILAALLAERPRELAAGIPRRAGRG